MNEMNNVSFHIYDARKKVTLIEYAAFFAVHGQNAEIIHIIENKVIEPQLEKKESIYKSCFNESIKCNHNDIANYFFNNYLLRKF